MREPKKRSVRIAHLIYSPTIGGSEIAAVEICSHLDRERYRPMVISMSRGRDGTFSRILSERGIPAFNLNRSRLKRPVWSLLGGIALARLRIDLLHVHHVPMLVSIWRAARLARIKAIVYTEHAKFSISRSSKLQRGCRRAARHVGCFTVISENLKSYFVHELGIESTAIKVIPNGVDTERFVPGPRSESLSSLLPPGYEGPVFVSVGRLTEAKDQVTLLSALELLRESHLCPYLVMVGEGELRHTLEKEIAHRRLGALVRLAGKCEDVAALLRGATGFVLSSKREGLPMAILEAMSAGLPIVASKVGGIPEAIRNEENGLLVPPQNPAMLAAGMKRLLLENGLSAKLGKSARKTIERTFSIERTSAQYSEIYTNVLNRVL